MTEERILARMISENSAFPGVEGNEWPMGSLPQKTIPEPPPRQEWPKISIVTPSFNQGSYLEKTIRSVLLQGYPNLEYIIIDGGSTDQSVEIIKKYAPWISWWVSEKDRGQSHAINKGLQKASGELLGWLNSDDYFLPGALFKLALAHIEDPSAGAIYGQGHIVDECGNIIYTPKQEPITYLSLFDWCFGSDFMQPSCLFTRKAWEEVGPVDEGLNFALDVEYWIRIAQKFQFKRIPDPLSISLSHPLAKTTAMRTRSHTELAIICMRHGQEEQAKRILNQILANYEETAKERDHYRDMSFLQTIMHAFNKLLSEKIG